MTYQQRVEPINSVRGLAKHILASVDEKTGLGLSQVSLEAMLLKLYNDAYNAGFQDSRDPR